MVEITKINKTGDTGVTPQGNMSLTEIAKVAKIMDRFRQLEDTQMKRYRYFNNLNLKDYIDASVRRMTLYQEQNEFDEDWQATTVMGTTRNKALTLLSQLLGQRTNVEFQDTERNDFVRPRIIEALWEYSLNKEDELGRDVDFNVVSSALEKGTAVVYEGFATRKTKIKKITNYDPLTGESTFKEEEVVVWNDCESILLDILDFFPGDITKKNIQDMPDCAWRTMVDIDMFKREFAGFKNINSVIPGGELRNFQFFKDYKFNSIADDQVEVIRYFSKVDDEFHIVANGVLLTPLNNPLPWNHKLQDKGLPFWSMRFEDLDELYFWGMSFPFKMKGHQDVEDVSYRMLINASLLALNPPILTDDSEFPEENDLFPGQVRYQAKGTVTEFMKMREPGESAYRLSQMANRGLDEASVSDTASGQLASGRRTATEIMQAQAESKKNASMFLRNIETAKGDHASLRVSNIKQFYPLPINSKGDFRNIKIKNMPLPMSGGRGTLEIIFVGGKKDLPPTQFTQSPEEIDKIFGIGASEVSIIVDQTTGMETIYLTHKALQETIVGIKVTAGSSIKMSEAIQIAMFDELEIGMLTNYGDLIDRKKLLKRKGDIRNENIEDFLLEPNNAQPTPGPTPGEEEGGLGELSSQLGEGFGGEKKSQETNKLTSLITNG